MKTKSVSYYQIRIGDGGYHSNKIDSTEQAREIIQNEYRGRNKGDGNDNYWHTVPLTIEQVLEVTTEIETI